MDGESDRREGTGSSVDPFGGAERRCKSVKQTRWNRTDIFILSLCAIDRNGYKSAGWDDFLSRHSHVGVGVRPRKSSHGQASIWQHHVQRVVVRMSGSCRANVYPGIGECKRKRLSIIGLCRNVCILPFVRREPDIAAAPQSSKPLWKPHPRPVAWPCRPRRCLARCGALRYPLLRL